MSKKSNKKVEPKYIESKLHNPMLNYSVYYMSTMEKFLVPVLSFLAGGLVSNIFFGGLFKTSDGYKTTATTISDLLFFVVVGLIVVKYAIPIYKANRKSKRDTLLKLQFRDMLQSLAASFSSGSNVHAAFEAAYVDLTLQYSATDYIVVELKEILDGVNQNIAVEDMLRDFAVRSGNEDVTSFVDVFTICYHKGGDMNSVISRTTSVISGKMEIMDEINTKLTSNKLQHNVMSLMPILIVGILKATNKSFADSFASPLGVIVNIIAIGIFIGAYVYGNKICQIKV